MEWCEANGVDYIFGLAGNDVLDALVRGVADELCVRRAEAGEEKRRTWTRLRYGAKSWQTAPRRRPPRGDGPGPRRPLRRHLARGLGQASLRDRLLRARPGRELHQAAQDPARLRPHLLPQPQANQFRLILHTAAYWLLHTLRAAAPKRSCWRTAEFTTLRLRLIKIAARVVEGAARIRVWLPTACPDAAIFRLLAGRFAAAGP